MINEIKRFILKTSILILSLIFILVFLFMFRFISTKSISWKLPSNKNVLFMGASHIQRGIDPKYYPSASNLAAASERYLFTYLKVKKIVKENSQIDTLFLQFATTDIQKNTDSKYYSKNEMSRFLPLYFPFLSSEDWEIYANNKSDALNLLVQKVFRNIPHNLSDYGRYKPNTGFFERKKEPYIMPKWSESGNAVNYRYLNKIIQICKEKKIKLIFLYMPMYSKELFYDTNYFYNIYKNKYSDILFLDYSDWDCPDNFRNDEHHLNSAGAISFTKKLKSDLANKIQ